MSADLATVFGDLADARRWVAWREVRSDDDVKKLPYSAVTGESKGWDDPAKWVTLDEALAYAENAGMIGAGIVLGDGLGGIDLDECRDPDTGELAPWARELITCFSTYAEVSPSGRGVKIFATGAPDDLPANRIRVGKPSENGKRQPGVEVYVKNRFFTVTGDILDGAVDELVDCGEPGGGWDRLTRLLRERTKKQKDASPSEVEERIPKGSRDNTLASLAGTMRARGMNEDEILAALAAVNEGRCNPPLPDATVEKIARSISRYPPEETLGRPTYTGPPGAMTETLETFSRWLHLPDPTPILAVLGTVAANELDGDPVWLGLVAPPSSAKTEILNGLTLLDHVHPVATLTPAGLLSGTPRKSQEAGAKGGILRKIGDYGILLAKDFGSVLSMRPEAKSEILAALREIYDGRWTRILGTDGGKELHWQGKVGLIFGATPALDSHHSVIGSMGERFLLCRLEAGGKEQATRARIHSGKQTSIMRQELAEAVAALFANERKEPRELTQEEGEELDELAYLAVRIRSTVERDRQSREVESIHGTEGPARLVLQLERLLAGLDTLGVEREEAFRVVRRVAMDSVPPLRRHALAFVRANTPCDTKTVAEALGLPTITVRRTLEDLAAYSLVTRIGGGQGKADTWEATP